MFKHAVTIALVLFAACSSNSSTPDASTTGGIDAAHAVDAAAHAIDAALHGIDAAVGSGNPLGIVCDSATPCPDGGGCHFYTTGASKGICSPTCSSADDTCVTGYTGPAGAMPTCFVSSTTGGPANQCAIICETPGTSECPSGTTCTNIPNGGGAMWCTPS